jgi:hypothetical protein
MRRATLAGILLLVTWVAIPGGSVAQQRDIPEDNLAYPVLISIQQGAGLMTGSGFYVNAGDSIWLVTAKHVLFDEQTRRLFECGPDPKTNKKFVCPVQLLSYSMDSTDQTRNVIRLDMAALQSGGYIKPHPTRDVVAIKLFAASAVPPAANTSASGPTPVGKISGVPGVSVESTSRDGLLGVAIANLKPFNQVLVGNEVIEFGYPTSLSLVRGASLDPTRPLLRKGIVAGVDPARQWIVLDCPAYFGNSGGPVVELDHQGFMTHLLIIGVVDQYVPYIENAGSNVAALTVAANSGYSLATPIDSVLELLK